METIYTVKQSRIKLKSINDSIDLWLWGDVHRDATGCDSGRWKHFLKKAARGDPDKTYYMGMGDYHDFASESEQRQLNNGTLHETTMERLNKLANDQNGDFAKEIEQMRGKLLGLVTGNHSWKFPNGITSDQDLANRMGCKSLGWLCYYVLTFDLPGGKAADVHIVACHGKAGGKRAGSSINQVEDMKTLFPLADIYVMGHDHARGAWPIDVLHATSSLGNINIKQKRQFLCRSGSFLRGYVPGTSSYVTGRLLRPADIGALKLNIGFHRDQVGGDRIITDIEAII